MILKQVSRAFALLAFVLLGAGGGSAADRFITVASTTSTEQSGLFKHLLPEFTAKTGIEVKVVALGTGQALDVGRRGDADVVFVHDRAAEEKFVEEGFGKKRIEVMYNDFVLIGPKSDPAAIRGLKIAEALGAIAKAGSPFISRGDRSGTHSAELRLWKESGIDPQANGKPWYREIGQGMGPALNAASEVNGHVLSDRGTWLSFANKGELEVLVQGDRRLFNQYAVMLVNPDRHAHIKSEDGQAFIGWLVSPEGQATINSYKINGEQLFFGNAIPGGS